jgi:hypothetical protein
MNKRVKVLNIIFQSALISWALLAALGALATLKGRYDLLFHLLSPIIIGLGFIPAVYLLREEEK